MSDEAERMLTVAELTARIKRTLEGAFAGVWVSGEISGYRGPHHSGHVYCTLKDGDSQIPLVLWRSTVSKLRFALEEGLEVNVFGNVEVYAPRGNYQLIATRIEAKGLGDLQVAFRQMCQKLEREGLFARERKRPLPRYPRRIGIVTAPTGAAIRDMLSILKRRDPRLSVILYPTPVQGEGAAASIAEGIAYLNRHRERLGIELVIVGRGGGSLEDLWAFNEEAVARAIFASQLPVVSAVGHEIDVTVADLVADVRAATPSEAAELVAPELAALATELAALTDRLQQAQGAQMDIRRQDLVTLGALMEAHSPARRLREEAQRLDFHGERMTRTIGTILERCHTRFEHLGERMDSLSPLKVLKRGYSVTQHAATGTLVRSVQELAKGDALEIRIHDGRITAQVAATHTLGPPTQDRDIAQP